jgi:hypothetical protein
MTAKEKTEELVYKFIEKDLVNPNRFDYELGLEIWSSKTQFESAKQCALIAVDEIFLVLPDIQEVWDFWGQVKKEIEVM